MSSQHGSYAASNCIDGIDDDANNYCHTNGEANPWISIELAALAAVGDVVDYRYGVGKVKELNDDGSVVVSQTVKYYIGLDEHEAELRVLVLAVALKVLPHRHRLLDEVVEVLRQLRSKTCGGGGDARR